MFRRRAPLYRFSIISLGVVSPEIFVKECQFPAQVFVILLNRIIGFGLVHAKIATRSYFLEVYLSFLLPGLPL